MISCDASLAGNSPTTLPAFITYTLSHIPKISGSSDEITKIDFPEDCYFAEQALLNDNIYIFGDSSDTVVERYAQGSYHAAKYYNENAAIKEAVDFITGEELKAIGDKDRLERLFNELVSKDWFMTFPDFDEYVKTREQAYADYENREEWVQKMLVNIAKAGYFSSDRTIEEYNRDIWKLED